MAFTRWDPLRDLLALQERIDRLTEAGDTAAIAPLTRHGTRELAELSAAFIDMARKLQARSDTVRTFASQEHMAGLFEKIHRLRQPVIAAVNGVAFRAGRRRRGAACPPGLRSFGRFLRGSAMMVLMPRSSIMSTRRAARA